MDTIIYKLVEWAQNRFCTIYRFIKLVIISNGLTTIDNCRLFIYRYLRTSDRKYDIFKIFYEEIYVAVLTSASECTVADKHRPSTLKILLMNGGLK